MNPRWLETGDLVILGATVRKEFPPMNLERGPCKDNPDSVQHVDDDTRACIFCKRLPGPIEDAAITLR